MLNYVKGGDFLTIGDKIRKYREFRGLSQVTLAKLSGINVGTIRKYELGIRNPKPDQLTKIADALGLNVSVFLDFRIETVGDVLSLLFAIDDAVDLKLEHKDDSKTVGFTFDRSVLQDVLISWSEFKGKCERTKNTAMKLEDEALQKKELEDLEEIERTWKLYTMGAAGSNFLVTKGTEGIVVKTSNT